MNIQNKNDNAHEWEGISYPLTISSINSKLGYYNIPFDSKLEIWRNEDYKLNGLLKGIIENHKDLEYKENGEIHTAGFLTGDKISATDNNYEYLINGFIIENVETTPIIVQNKSCFYFSATVFFEDLHRIYTGKDIPEIISEWYLCTMPKIIFSNRTEKYPNSKIIKVREGIDQPIENKESLSLSGYSSSRNFAVLNYKKHKIIIQKISSDYLPYWTDGISIEYRNINSELPTTEFKQMIQEYLSFILGSHLQLIGTTEYSEKYNILSIKSQNPWKQNVRKGFAMNPIPLKNGADRLYFEGLINKLLPSFADNYESLALSDSLWKLWIGSEHCIGVNLPILASGLETLIDSYLEREGKIKKYSKSEKLKYKNLISEEFASLENKLKTYEFGQFVLNKLSNPYNLGVGEKMKIFFKNLEINFDKESIENQALQARNIMAHQRLDSSNFEDLQHLKKLSDAYITLFHRAILKILNYNGYYIDYSKKGINYININNNM